MEYFKINSLWKRDEKKQNNFIVGDYSLPEFGNIKKWYVEEKIDGTNIRIFFKDGKVSFGGKTKNAQLQSHLLEYLQKTFTDSLMQACFKSDDGDFPNMILFGEGYGPKIQTGQNYRADVGFILFDVFINGWWFARENVKETALKLGINMVPFIGIMSEEQVIDYVKSKPFSLCSIKPQIMEGVICRTEPVLLLRNGTPLLWKLKSKEF